jgi:branched-chain amino acid transport system permease protein
MAPELVANLQLLLNGMATGAIYALVALGLVITYKATEVLNFAHGDVLMASAFVAWALIVEMALPFWLAALLTASFAAVLAWQIDARVMRRIVGQPQFAGVMLTIAVAFMLRGLVSMVFGPESRSYPTPWTQQSTQIGTLVISDLSLVILAAALILTVMIYVFLTRTALGVSIQAASQNQLAAYLSGIRVKQVTSLVWALAGAIAGICGLLLAPIALLKALAALVLGGFGSIPGAILGGLLLGVIEQFAGVYLPDGSKDVTAYVVLIATLVLWPRGLLGEAHGRRV